MLTYDTLRGFVTKERESSRFVRLPEDFLSQASSYLEGKEKLQKDTWELSSARRLVNDLIELRQRKILNAAFYFVTSGVSPENLMDQEKALFDSVVNLLKDFNTKQPVKEDKIQILKDVPEFMGPGMQTIGPLKKGQILPLPRKVADILVKKGAAKDVI